MSQFSILSITIYYLNKIYQNKIYLLTFYFHHHPFIFVFVFINAIKKSTKMSIYIYRLIDKVLFINYILLIFKSIYKLININK